MAKECVERRVAFLTWGPKLQNDVLEHTLVRDGTARMWMFSGGLDTAKDPPKYASAMRMKGSIDEEHLRTAVDTMAKGMGDGDVGLWISGRNVLIAKEMKRNLSALRPRLGIKELAMEADEEQFLSQIRVDGNNAGSIDIKERPIITWLHFSICACRPICVEKGEGNGKRKI